MGKAGRWLKSLLAGKKDGGGKGEKQASQQHGDATPAAVAAGSREKKRWSFRRSAAAAGKMAAGAAVTSPSTPEPSVSRLASVSERDSELEQSKHAMAVAVATAAAAAQAAAAVIRMTAVAEEEEDDMSAFVVEDAAAVRIQATFRGYLARKALCALRGLVKLQALIRGNLVRKQATATLRRMQALLLAQSRIRAQRMRMLEEEEDDDDDGHHQHHPAHRRSPHHPRHPHRRSYGIDRSGEEHAKIVEMDVGEPARRRRSSYSVAASESRERRMSEYYGQCSPAPSSAAAAFTELTMESPRDAYSGHIEDFAAAMSFEPATARSSSYVPISSAAASDFFPNYMANTQSSRAKARSQSAPRQRTESPPPPQQQQQLERQPSRRRHIPRSAKMQRSSSHVGVPAMAHGYHHQYGQYPWPLKPIRSSTSLKDSECGSTTSSILTAATTVGFCHSLVGFELHRSEY
ncbi:hypothetical protein GUJ93_ZPchr0010g9605 [Zizania palustris]|uniref:DUF4005 domain-containing protein n=1 Tax=Zizania palustris TaxID=103762 RepID=A0A8J6BRG6_ZIZPA|nr:hypothetical protein GUJ93_ZPchr0010g9605 [Zizania palustris]